MAVLEEDIVASDISHDGFVGSGLGLLEEMDVSESMWRPEDDVHVKRDCQQQGRSQVAFTNSD